MNDMRTKQWFVKIHYNGTLVEVREIWADTEALASIYAHKHAAHSLDTQLENTEETTLRLMREKLAAAEQDLHDVREWMHSWPEYMDDTDEDRANREANQQNANRLSRLVCDLRQTIGLTED